MISPRYSVSIFSGNLENASMKSIFIAKGIESFPVHDFEAFFCSVLSIGRK